MAKRLQLAENIVELVEWPLSLQKVLAREAVSKRAHMSRDTYNIQGQGGAMGPNAHAHDMTFQQIWSKSGLDLHRLAQELARLGAAMKQETEGRVEQDNAIGAVIVAEKAAAHGDGPTVLRHLKAAGKWPLEIAEKIGVAVVVEAIKTAMQESA